MKTIVNPLEGSLDEKLAATDAVVWADDFAQHCLWRQWAVGAMPVSWENAPFGHGPTIGTLDGRPVVLSLRWALVNSRMICFADAVSEVMDVRLAEKWIRERAPRLRGSDRDFINDGSNFDLAIRP